MGYKRPRTYALTPSRKRIGKHLLERPHKLWQCRLWQTQPLDCMYSVRLAESFMQRWQQCVQTRLHHFCEHIQYRTCHTSSGRMSYKNWRSLHRIFFTFMAMHSNKDTKTESWRHNWCVRCNHSQKSFCENESVTEDCVSASLRWALWKKSKWFAWTLAKYYLNFLQVYERLQTLNLTMSISSTRRLVKTLGTGYDQKVKDWRDLLATTLSVRNKIKQ